MRDLPTRAIDYRPVSSLTPARRNARTHSHKQIRPIATSIERFGFTNPVLVDDEGSIIAGHGRVAAAKLLGIEQIPVVPLGDLSPKERQAYALADNKLALNAGWDQDLLALEFQELIDAGFEVELTGFSLAEVDFTLDLARQQQPGPEDSAADRIPEISEHAVSRPGDLWCLGNHLPLCGDAWDPAHYDRLLQGGQVGLVFTDPPYNVPIDGHVCGLGRIRHREFAMGVGEMAAAEFCSFLTVALTNMAARCQDGAILYVCMDWRHLEEISAAGRLAALELKNLCVWNKTNGGMGSFYRSKHELVFVFKHGVAPHVNNFGLGDTGRYRTNVWDYPGISSIRGKRAEELAMHPTVMRGGVLAQRTFFELMKAEDERFHQAQEARFEFWEGYQETARNDIAAANKQGLPEPEWVPHPVDIDLNYQPLEVTFLGAMDAEGLKAEKQALAFQRLGFEMAAYLDEDNCLPSATDPERRIGICMAMHLFERHCLPPRLRLTGEALEAEILPISGRGMLAWGDDLERRCAEGNVPFLRAHRNLRLPTRPMSRLGVRWVPDSDSVVWYGDLFGGGGYARIIGDGYGVRARVGSASWRC